MRAFKHAVFFALAVVSAAPALAQSSDPNIVHVQPLPVGPQGNQPWLPPTYQSPHGTVQDAKPVKPLRAHRHRAAVPPPIVNPQTGVALPNMPTVSPSGPGGRETYQDRAVRCAHQAGSYGANAGDRGTYIGTCINQ
jgi:hypothetical protein